MNASTESKHAQFVADMKVAGIEVRIVKDYRGRNFYVGPAAIIDREQLQDAIRATSVRLWWDQMGRDDLIVYPA
jgi:hypothetical protein